LDRIWPEVKIELWGRLLGLFGLWALLERRKGSGKESMMMLPKVRKGEKRISPLEREKKVRAAIGLITDWEEMRLAWVCAIRVILLEQVVIELHERDVIQ
jgi:hypothetical protein